MLRLGQTAPDFEQETANGSIRLHDWVDASWAVLFSYRHAYDPIVSAELAEVARLKPEWDRRGVRVLGLSGDTARHHRAWERRQARPLPGTMLNFPVITDSDGAVGRLYGLIDADGEPAGVRTDIVHAILVIDPQKRLRLIQLYPPSLPRSFANLLRPIDCMTAADRSRGPAPPSPAIGRPDRPRRAGKPAAGGT